MILFLCAYCALTLARRTADGSMALFDLCPTPPDGGGGVAYAVGDAREDGERPIPSTPEDAPPPAP